MKLLTLSLVVMATMSLQAQNNPEKSLQSGDQPVEITITNAYPTTVAVSWVDFNGRPQNYGSLPPGNIVQVQSYPGHLWRFAANGQATGRYRATFGKKQSYTVSENHPEARRSTPPVQSPNPAGTITSTNRNGRATIGQQLWDFVEKETGVRVTTNRPGGGVNSPAPPATPNNPTGNPVPPAPVPSTAPVNQVPAPAANSVTPAITQTGSKLTAVEAQALVDYHNQARREVGVGPVTWSPQIAAFAQEWADELARRGAFQHRPASQQRYGENLAGGTTGAFTVKSGVDMWYGEKNLYRPGAAFSATFLPAGHYTQMVWNTSNQIGAGMAVCQTGQYRGWTILVCNYAERGNVIGRKPY